MVLYSTFGLSFSNCVYFILLLTSSRRHYYLYSTIYKYTYEDTRCMYIQKQSTHKPTEKYNKQKLYNPYIHLMYMCRDKKKDKKNIQRKDIICFIIFKAESAFCKNNSIQSNYMKILE